MIEPGMEVEPVSEMAKKQSEGTTGVVIEKCKSSIGEYFDVKVRWGNGRKAFYNFRGSEKGKKNSRFVVREKFSVEELWE